MVKGESQVSGSSASSPPFVEVPSASVVALAAAGQRRAERVHVPGLDREDRLGLRGRGHRDSRAGTRAAASANEGRPFSASRATTEGPERRRTPGARVRGQTGPRGECGAAGPSIPRGARTGRAPRRSAPRSRRREGRASRPRLPDALGGRWRVLAGRIGDPRSSSDLRDAMASKAEYLKRYLSGAGDDAAGARGDAGEKKKRRRKKDGDAPSGAHHLARGQAGGRGRARRRQRRRRLEARAREDADAARRRDEEAPVVVTEDGRETTEADGPRPPRAEGTSASARTRQQAVADDDDARRRTARRRSRRRSGDVSPPRLRRARHDTDSDDDEGANTAGAEEYVAAAAKGQARQQRRRGRRRRPIPFPIPVPPRDDALQDPPPRPQTTRRTSPPRAETEHTPLTITPPHPLPPRRRVGEETASFAGGDDLSPPRRRGRGGEAGGLSSASRGDADLSPPRRGAPPMTDGTRTGLVAASEVVREAAERRAAAMRRVAAMSDEASGRGAAARVRDKATGAALSDAEGAAEARRARTRKGRWADAREARVVQGHRAGPV